MPSVPFSIATTASNACNIHPTSTICYIPSIVSIIFSLCNSQVINNTKRNKPQTVLIRILTTYFQAVMIVLAFNLSWPPQVQEALKVFSFVSSSQEMILSVDCLYLSSGLNFGSDFNTFYLKVVSFGILPVAMIFIAALIWVSIDMYRRYRNILRVNIRQNMTATTFIIIYSMYPTLANVSFSIFNCVDMDDGNSYLKNDINTQCWTDNHKKMALIIGFPLIFVWVIGFPIFIIFKLHQYRKQFNDSGIIATYGLFFVGLNDNAYCWEICVQNVRKLVFIVCSTFFSTADSQYKALIGICVLYVQSQLLYSIKPYIDPRLNRIEYHAQFASVITLIAGYLFVEEQIQQNDTMLLILFLLVVISNSAFIALWGYHFCSILLRMHIRTLQTLSFCVCLKGIHINRYDEDLALYNELKKRELQIVQNMMAEQSQIDIWPAEKKTRKVSVPFAKLSTKKINQIVKQFQNPQTYKVKLPPYQTNLGSILQSPKKDHSLGTQQGQINHKEVIKIE